MKTCVIALFASFVAGGALAQVEVAQVEAAPQDGDTVGVQWEQSPREDEVDDLYPPLAVVLGIDGDANVQCTAEVDGSITACEIQAWPEGFGFEQAALAIIERRRVRPRTVGGVPERAMFSFSVPFRMDREAPPPYEGLEPSPSRMASARAWADRVSDLAFVFGPDLDLLSPDEARRVRPLLAIAFAAHRDDWVKALALLLARTVPQGLEDLLSLHTLSLLFPSDENASVTDELVTVQTEIWDQTRRMYCARYGCGARPDPLPPLKRRDI